MAVFAFTYSETSLLVLQQSLTGRVKRGAIALPQGVIGAGRISDTRRFGELLKQGLTQAQPKPIKANRAIIGLPEEYAFLKTIELPAKLHARELELVIENQWQTLLPIPRAQVDFTFFPLKAKPIEEKVRKKEKEKKQHVLVIAYPRDIISGLLNALRSIDITPEVLLPLSFGYASLMSPADKTPGIVTKSDTGQNISAIITQDSVAHFSTTIHTEATNPSSGKQLDNIRSFYEKNMNGSAKISSITILPGPFSDDLTRQFGSLGLPATTATLPKPLTTKDNPYEGVAYLPLFGLLKQRQALSLFPNELASEMKNRREHLIYRANILSMTTTFLIILYISFAFLDTLTKQSTRQPLTPHKQKAILETRAQEVSVDAQAVNTQIARLVTADNQRSNIHLLIPRILERTKALEGLTITTITTNNGTVTIEGTQKQTSQSALLMTELQKGFPSLPEFATITVINTSPADPSRFSLELKGGNE